MPTDRRAFPHTHMPAFMFWPIPAGPDQALRHWQDGRCAMCGDTREQLVMDHCHHDGRIRGLLCRSCNSVEPHSDGEHWVAWRSGRNPARIFGRDDIYVNAFGRTPLRLPDASDESLDRIAEAMSR